MIRKFKKTSSDNYPESNGHFNTEINDTATQNAVEGIDY